MDRMQVGVRGTWRLSDARPHPRPITPESYSSSFGEINEQRPWFRKPQVDRRGMELLTLARAQTSLGSTRVFVSGFPDHQGNFTVSLTCNPTETLAHLLAFSAVETDFMGWANSLTPFGFFDRRGVRPSLDGRENWLPDLDLARHHLGPDVFGAFFPIFARKLMQLVAQLVAPVGPQLVDDGTDVVAQARNLTVRLDWANATVPQIETYFERHHNEARATVRSVAQAMLTSLDETRVRHHLHRVSFERQEDLFSVRSQLPADRDLSVYAKAPDRLRFEITRPKRGRYPPQLLSRPEDRLLQIFRTEREELPECCDWDAVAALFVEPKAPLIGDLVAMVSAIADVCASHGVAAQPIFEALLVDGGLRGSLEGLPEGLVDQLRKRGVIERVTLRKRNRPGEQRYSLKPDYLWLTETVKTALATHISPTLSPYRRTP